MNTFAFSDYSDQENFQAKYYDNAKVLRVKYTQGEAFVQRSYDDGFEEAAVNLPIFEKDRVGTTEGRVEVYLGRLNYLRLDYDTEVEFDRIPELRKTDAALRIRKGGIFLDIENLDHERDIEVQTPDCGIFLLDKGVYRINVSEGGHTEVYVFEGIAEVSGEHYSRNVRGDQKIVMSNGDVKERPFYFHASETDGFDHWNRERNDAVGYARYSTSRYLDRGYEDHEYELSRSGRWIYHTSYREYIWIPYNIGVGWSPYYHGRWLWTPYYGYYWCSHDPWGYFTHHYGRWHWDTFYGWHWARGYRWSPAWVYWFWDDHHYGWSPLSRWNRPVIVLNKRWMRNYNHRRGIPIHSRGTIIIKKNQLGASHIRKVALNKSLLTKNTIVAKGKGFAPKIKPRLDKVKVINARGKSVAYKKSGFLSSRKYQEVKSTAGVSNLKKETVYKHPGSKEPGKKAFKYSRPVKSGSSKSFSELKETKSTKPSSYKYKSKSKSSSSSSKYKSSSKSKSSSKRSTSSRGYKSSKSKKEKKEPSYFSARSSSSSNGGKSYSSSSYKSSSTYNSYKKPSSQKRSYSSSNKSYKPSYNSKYNSSGSSSSYKSSPSYKSYSKPSYKSSYKSSSSYKSYSKPSYKSSYKSSSSYKSYSKPSYKSSYKSSSSYKSYSKPSYKSSSSSDKSYSKPRSSSYSKSSRSSRSYSKSSSRSSRSSSSRSSSSRSSSRSSSKKK